VASFRIAAPQNSSIYGLYLQKDEIWLEPPYQRMGEVWNVGKKQLLIDSLLNEFDIPKLYFHDFYPAESVTGHDYRYAIIDGKQRLNAVWGFIEGEFALGAIELLNQPNVDIKGMTYGELGETHPRIKAQFDATLLPVVTVITQDTELIEEMFSRLNEAVPLNAAEQRNAFGGPIPPVVREVSKHPFMEEIVPFSNNRYRHFDLVCKFLLLEEADGLTDLKKEYLDEFVKNFRDRDAGEAKYLQGEVEETFDVMREVFVKKDELLQTIGMFTLHYLIYGGLSGEPWARDVPRRLLKEFEDARLENRVIAQDGVGKASYDLLEFDRFAQSPNDRVALEFRLGVLLEWLAPRMQ
jgi:hypothetical protein